MSKKNRGRRRLGVVIASAIAAFAASAVSVSAASADTITLDHGFLKISGLEDPTEIIDGGTGPVLFNNVTYSGGGSGGDFSVTTADVVFPAFNGEVSGVPLTVQVTPLATMNGNYNAATGVMTTSTTNFQADISLGPPVNASCTITPIPLALSTADNAVFKGDVFDAGLPPTNGAITDDWASLPPDPDTECGLINGLTAGPGALWLSNGVATPTANVTPPPTTTPPATKPKCKKGQKLKKVKGKFKCVKKKKKKKK